MDVQGANVVDVDRTLGSSVLCKALYRSMLWLRENSSSWYVVGWVYPVCYLVTGLLRVVLLGPEELP